MNTRLITESEIAQRQFEVREGAYRARHAFTISGIRRVIGNTLIAFGMRMHGKSEIRGTATIRRKATPAHGV